jgi:ABC-2 type transport system permease protein
VSSGNVSATAVGRSLAVRDLARMRRYPAVTVQLLFLPVFFVVVWSGGFDAAARLPGFPAPRLLDWILPLGVLAGCAPAAMIPGFAVARDVEAGFFDRLLVAPVPPVALVAGPLAAGVCRAAVPFVVVTFSGLLLGVQLPGGVIGILMLLVAAAGTSLCAAGWGVGLALRLGTIRRSTHLMQAGSSFVLYLSTGLAPPSIMTPWLRAVARVNPMTHVLALARQGLLGPVTWDQTWPGLLALLGGSAAFVVFAARGLRRLAR